LSITTPVEGRRGAVVLPLPVMSDRVLLVSVPVASNLGWLKTILQVGQ
jgi:hypothetical protein